MHHVIRNKEQRGFTLIEAVVSTSLFAFVVVSILAVYMSALQLDKKTRSQRAVAQSARFIMEYLAKEVRNGRIYYNGYPSSTAQSDCTSVGTCGDLYIENLQSEIEHIYLNGTDLVLTKNSGPASNLNASNVKITKLKFYVRPTQDPFNPAKTINQQPYVTVLMELTSNYGNRPVDTVIMNLQSTLSTRLYPSRN